MELTEFQNNYEKEQGENCQILEKQENNKSLSNQNNSSSFYLDTNIWYILSIISWVLFLVTIWNLFLTHSGVNFGFSDENYPSPLVGNLSYTYGFIIIIGTTGFIFYFKKISFEKNQNLMNGMLGDISQFHCIPFFLITMILILLSTIHISACIFIIILSLLAYSAFIYIYLNTYYEAEWYIVFTIKKGTFSCLIALTWYFFWGFINILNLYRDMPDINFIKNSGIVFLILIGLGNIGFGFWFKDLIILVTNFLIYNGILQYYINGFLGKWFKLECIAVDIIIILINCLAFVYLIKEKSDQLLRT